MKTQRVLAYIIDAILIGIVSSILCFLAGLDVKTLWSSGGIRVLYNPVMLMNLGVAAVYFLTDVLNHGSPGKKMLGLVVMHTIPDRDRFATAAIRSLVKVLSIHVLIGIIIFLIRDQYSSLHDKVAGTRVEKNHERLPVKG